MIETNFNKKHIFLLNVNLVGVHFNMLLNDYCSGGNPIKVIKS
jgi:hypothetical protein